MNTTASSPYASRTCSAQARCPMWMGSKVPPMIPNRAGAPSAPKLSSPSLTTGERREATSPGRETTWAGCTSHRPGSGARTLDSLASVSSPMR